MSSKAQASAPTQDRDRSESHPAERSKPAVSMALVPDEATGIVTVRLSCQPLSRQPSITDGQSLIVALEQEEKEAKGELFVKLPASVFTSQRSEENCRTR